MELERATSSAPAWSEPTRLAAAWHTLKTWGHVVRRTAQNSFGGPRRIERAQDMAGDPIVAEHRSALWIDGRADEFILRCGKVQNLRVAIRRFHGVEVAAGQTLSFWSQLGRPSAAAGFVVGREIVNGCVVPTVGGGLCQISNALASLAVAAGARLVERHRHSALIEEQALSGEDATVAWNYVDLRIAADFAFRIEAELSPDELVLRMRAPRATRAQRRVLPRTALPILREDRQVARGCLTCDRTSCFRHKQPARPAAGRTAVLLNDRHPELGQWLDRLDRKAADWMVPWVRPGLRSRAWAPPPESHAEFAFWPSCKRIVRQHLLRGEGAARQGARAQAAADLAQHYAHRLRPEHTELVVTQDLLVPLWRLGVLGGRSFDVYVPELPASELQTRLDDAASRDRAAASLRDFRVDAAWQQDEWNALALARTRMTAHHDVHRTLRAAGLTVELLPWVEPMPASISRHAKGDRPTLTLASSALARKGATEVAAAARTLGARVLILGSAPGDASPWQGVEWSAVGYSSDWLAQSDVVLLPAFIEHQPRALLRALAAGVPVVATAACGLGARAGLTEIQPGDASALEAALRAALAPVGTPQVAMPK